LFSKIQIDSIELTIWNFCMNLLWGILTIYSLQVKSFPHHYNKYCKNDKFFLLHSQSKQLVVYFTKYHFILFYFIDWYLHNIEPFNSKEWDESYGVFYFVGIEGRETYKAIFLNLNFGKFPPKILMYITTITIRIFNFQFLVRVVRNLGFSFMKYHLSLYNFLKYEYKISIF